MEVLESLINFGSILNKLNITLNIIQAIAGLLVVIIILLIWYFDKTSVDRVSLKFTFIISLVDIIRAIAVIFYNNIKEDDFFCSLASFFLHWLILVYFMLNAMFALNLQLVFVHNITLGTEWEIGYWIFSFLFPFILMLAPLVNGKLGFDEYAYICEFKSPLSSDTHIYIWSTFLFWAIAACLYCAIAVVLVIIQLRKKVNSLDNVFYHDTHSRYKRSKSSELNRDLKAQLQKIIIRISLCCTIPVVTHTSYIVIRVIAMYSDQLYLTLNFISVILSDLPGLLNFIVFLIDPAFTKAFEKVKNRFENSPIENTIIKEEFVNNTSGIEFNLYAYKKNLGINQNNSNNSLSLRIEKYSNSLPNLLISSPMNAHYSENARDFISFKIAKSFFKRL